MPKFNVVAMIWSTTPWDPKPKCVITDPFSPKACSEGDIGYEAMRQLRAMGYSVRDIKEISIDPMTMTATVQCTADHQTD